MLATISTANGWPSKLHLPSQRFVLLLAWDARSASADDISALADSALDQGLVYLCAWGAGCERVHDVFDEVCVDRELRGLPGSGVMTTWHDDESLEAAAQFAVQLAHPAPESATGCGTVLAVGVGNAAPADRLERALRAATAAA
jgi:hypothetical protein